MAMSNELLDFTRRALAADIERHKIADALAEAGWPEARIRATLSHYACTTDFPIPVPVPPPRFSAREAFVYCLLFSAMFVALWYFSALSFEIVDYLLPDPTETSFAMSFYDYAARWDISVLIVAFPIFALLFYATNRHALDYRDRKLSLARRWLTYVALFVAAVTLFGDLVVLVSNLVAGSLTGPLFAKVAIVAIIVGGVFIFYSNLVLFEEVE